MTRQATLLGRHESTAGVGLAAQHQGHRPVSRRFDHHVRPEHAAGHRDGKRVAEGLIDRLGPLRWSRADEGRAPPLAGVAIERELADGRDPAADLPTEASMGPPKPSGAR